MKKQPEVTVRTRKKFIDTFWELCEEKNVKQITAGEVARRAGYNRSTFYEYFTDISDLLDQAEGELLASSKQTMTKLDSSDSAQSPNAEKEIFEQIFHLLNQKAYCLLGPNGDPAFLSRLKMELLPRFAEMLGVPQDLPSLSYIVAFTYSATIGFLQYWHEQGQDMPEEEACELGYELLFHGVLDVLNRLKERD